MEGSAPERVERRLAAILAAILAADVAGSSRLMGRDEAGTLARLKACRRELIDPQIAEHKGRIVKTIGDGILIDFPNVVEAVGCALAEPGGICVSAIVRDRVEGRHDFADAAEGTHFDPRFLKLRRSALPSR